MPEAGQIASVVLVLGALIAIAWVLKAKKGQWGIHLRGTNAATRRMRLVERLSLGANQALHLVEIDNHLALVLTSGTSCQVVRVDAGASPASAWGRRGEGPANATDAL